MINLNTLDSDVMLHLWPYFVKNGDAPAISLVCRKLAAANVNFIDYNRKRIVTVLEKTDSPLCRGIRYLTKRVVNTREDFYKFNAAIRSFIMNTGCPCPTDRLLLAEDILSCSKEFDRMREDEALETIWRRIAPALYDFNPHDQEARGIYVNILPAKSIRDWMFFHQYLIRTVISLNLSKLKLNFLPKEIEQFVNLQNLNLQDNRLINVCPELLRLENLQRIELTKNLFFAGFPPTIGDLAHQGHGIYFNPQAL